MLTKFEIMNQKPIRAILSGCTIVLVGLLCFVLSQTVGAQETPQEGEIILSGANIPVACSCEGNWCREWPLPQSFPRGYKWKRKTVTSFITGPHESGIGGTFVTEQFLGGRCVKMTGSHAVTDELAPAGFSVTEPGTYTLTITTLELGGVADCNHPTCSGVSTITNNLTIEKRYFTVKSDCDCRDIGDIKRRIEEAEVAIAAYNAQRTFKIVGNVSWPAEKVGYTPQRRDQVQFNVQEALSQNLKGRKSLGANGDTDNVCNVKNNAKTACMRESIRVHEEVHRQACLKHGGISGTAKSTFTGEDRFQRDEYTMGEFIDEEIKAYQEELSFLTKAVRVLEKRCSK